MACCVSCALLLTLLLFLGARKETTEKEGGGIGVGRIVFLGRDPHLLHNLPAVLQDGRLARGRDGVLHVVAERLLLL